MNPELLRTVYFGLETLYPPLPNLDKQILTDIYGQINQRYNYISFVFLGNGAQLSESGGTLCRILNDRIQISEENLQADIQIYKEKAVDILRIVQQKTRIPVFLMQAVTLRALWQCAKEQNSIDIIWNKFLKIEKDDISKLERPIAGIGLRFNSPMQENVMDFRIEPWFRDITQIFIELRGEFPQPVQSIEHIEKRVDQVYDYLFTQIRGLLSESTVI